MFFFSICRFVMEFVTEGKHNKHHPHQCNECFFSCLDHKRMIQHRFRHVFYKDPANKNYYFCPHCAAGFVKQVHQKKHKISCQKKDQIADEVKMKCQNCPKYFILPKFLQNHQSYCSINSRPYTCIHCGEVFSSQALYNQHIKLVGPYHSKNCVQCQTPFETWAEHTKHVRISHDGVWKFICGMCEELFDNMELQKAHR